ncbi:MAG: amidohydrolase family protein [Rhizobiaceae bacterium]
MRDVELGVSGAGTAVVGPSGDAGNGLLAMTPPVNAHDHGYGIRPYDFGCLDDALEPWIAGLRNRPATDPYLEALVAFGRLALNGCGATLHCHNSLRVDRVADEVAAVVRAAKDCGIRLALSCPLLDIAPWTYGGAEALRPHVPPADWPEFAQRMPVYAPPSVQIDAVSDLVRTYSGTLTDIQLGPIGPQWCSDAMLEAIAEASERLDCRIHMHLLESPRQRHWLDVRFPQGVVRHLHDIGFLSPRLAVAHGVQLRPDECDLLAEHGVIVVANPTANLRLRSGVAPVATFRKTGLRFALGLDGTGFSDDQDIWQELRLLRLLHGGNGIEADSTAGGLFDAAVTNGGTVIGQPVHDDLVLIDFGSLTADAMYDDLDEAEILLGRMSGTFVKDLYVAGTRIVADRRISGFDFPAARAELAAQARRLAARNGAERAFADRLKQAIRQFYGEGWA